MLRALDGRAGIWRDEAVARRIILIGDAPPNDEALRPLVLQLAANLGATVHPMSIVGDIETSSVVSGLAVTRFNMAAVDAVSAPLTIPVEIFTVLIGNDTTTTADFESLAAATGGLAFNATNASDVVTALLAAINVPVNQAPVNVLPVVENTTEDTVLVFSSTNGNSITISDADAFNIPVAVNLTADNGTLTLTSTTGLTITTGDGTGDTTTTFTGTISNINTALNGLSFTPTANYNGAAIIQLTTNDQGNGGGAGLIDSDSVGIIINPVNDAPVLTKNNTLTLAETTTTPLAGNLLQVFDLDNNPNQITYTLTDAPDFGTLKLNGGHSHSTVPSHWRWQFYR